MSSVKLRTENQQFRCVISRVDIWQGELRRRLQGSQEKLNIGDPFYINSSGVIDFIGNKLHNSGLECFLLGVGDMYYSIRGDMIRKCIEEIIAKYRMVKSQNEVGCEANAFLKLRYRYLDVQIQLDVQISTFRYLKERGRLPQTSCYINVSAVSSASSASAWNWSRRLDSPGSTPP